MFTGGGGPGKSRARMDALINYYLHRKLFFTGGPGESQARMDALISDQQVCTKPYGNNNSLCK